MASDAPSSNFFVRRVMETIISARDTTFYSKHQIVFAGRGICLRSIFALIQSLLSRSFDAVYAKSVLRIGATSGLGWSFGIYAAAGLCLDIDDREHGKGICGCVSGNN
jgi:hypothetical protein